LPGVSSKYVCFFLKKKSIIYLFLYFVLVYEIFMFLFIYLFIYLIILSAWCVLVCSFF
jgi:hypothetical protein